MSAELLIVDTSSIRTLVDGARTTEESSALLDLLFSNNNRVVITQDVHDELMQNTEITVTVHLIALAKAQSAKPVLSLPEAKLAEDLRAPRTGGRARSPLCLSGLV